MQILIVAFLSLYIVCGTAHAKRKDETCSPKNCFDGVLEQVDMGDYPHLIVSDGTKKRNFVCVEGCEPFDTEPSKYIGRKVRVLWKKGHIENDSKPIDVAVSARLR
jgi:hypothetical protein